MTIYPNQFYVYAFLREDMTPYYIGKGSKNRLWEKRKGTQQPKDKWRVVVVQDGLTEADAFEFEKRLITLFGRKDLGTGILLNRTIGGEGAVGRKSSPETRAKISKASMGRIKTQAAIDKQRQSNAGFKHSPETRLKIGQASASRTHTEGTKEKIRTANSGERNYMYGKTHSNEAREQIRQSRLGTKQSAEAREKMSKNRIGKSWSAARRTAYERKYNMIT